MLTWTVWPARRRPHLAAATVLLILGVSWYGYASLGSPLYSMVALVVLTAALAPFFFPTTYALDRQGVSARGFLSSRHKRWDQLACFLRAEDFIALSTAAQPTERSIRSGLVLRLADNGDEVAAFLQRFIPQWHQSMERADDG